ncbi:MAG: hypothetical protein WAZ34_07065 [Rhodocyclaceae bacterium]
MNNVKKTTLSYDESEDRLRLAIEDDAGQASALWLTQRLAGRLVQALVRWLGSEADHRVGTTRDAVQSWEQDAALALHRGSEPVQINGEVRRGLLTSIDLARHAGDVHSVIFHWADDQAACLNLTMVELRQWLGIMHGLYVKAEWPRQVWPSWFELPIVERSALALH